MSKVQVVDLGAEFVKVMIKLTCDLGINGEHGELDDMVAIHISNQLGWSPYVFLGSADKDPEYEYEWDPRVLGSATVTKL